jgi:hypothetical protein
MSEPISEQRLGDYVDGVLSENEAAEVERRLAESAGARATVDFLRSLRVQAERLPEAIEPDRDLWPGIRARMAPAPLAPVAAPARDETMQVGASPAGRRIAPGAPGSDRLSGWPRLAAPQWAALAAAAMFLVVGSATITAWMMGAAAPADGSAGAETTLGDPSASGVALDAALPPEARYAVQIEQLLWTLYENRESLDPDTVTTIETNLRVIDRAIRTAREALNEDPGHAGLSRMLDSSYRRKLELLQRASRIIEMS